MNRSLDYVLRSICYVAGEAVATDGDVNFLVPNWFARLLENDTRGAAEVICVCPACDLGSKRLGESTEIAALMPHARFRLLSMRRGRLLRTLCHLRVLWNVVRWEFVK